MKNFPLISGGALEYNYPINLYFQPQYFEGRDAMRHTPGLSLWKELDSSLGIRGAVTNTISGTEYLYVVSGKKVYRLSTAGVSTEITGTLDTKTGHVSMEKNANYIVIVDGSKLYYISGTTLSLASLPAGVTPGTVTYIDSYFVINDINTGKFYVSGQDDPTSWDSLDFATAEAHPDDLVAVHADAGELFLFGRDTIEIYYNSGLADFPFARIGGAVIDSGIKSKDSIATIDNLIYYLANDNTVKVISKYSPQVISPPALSQQINELQDTSDAIGMAYKQNGNAFYVLTFPTGDTTFVFNATTGRWHKWLWRNTRNKLHRHRAGAIVTFDGQIIAGDHTYGRLYKVEDDVYTDNNEIIRRQLTAPIVIGGRERIIVNRVEIEMKTGVGLASGQGSDPVVYMQKSNDGGRSWSNEREGKFGVLGQYNARVYWDRCGAGRTWMIRFSMSDPVEVAFFDPLWARYDVCRH